MMSDGEFEDDFDDFGVADLSPEDFDEELAGLSPEMLSPEDIFGGEFDAPADEDVDLQVQDYIEGQPSPLNVNLLHQPVHLPRRPEKTMASVYTTLDARTQEELQQRMFEAAHHGYTRALEELLNGGVPVDKQHESNKNFTALMYASNAGREEAVKILLSRKFNTKPNCLSTNKHRMTAMHLACYHGYLGIIKMMIASKRSPGMDIDEYNQRLRDGQGALPVATQFDSGFFKKLLLGRTKERWTPLMVAVKRGHLELVRYLLQYSVVKTRVPMVNKEGQSVVHIAAHQGNLDCLKVFAGLENAVEIFKVQDKNGWNVLHHSCASHTNNLVVLRWLLEEFSHCDQLKSKDFLNQVKQGSKEYSPLLVACMYHKTDTVKHLLSLPEVNSKAKTSEGLTGLHLAAMHDDVDIAQELIEKGCPIDSQDEKLGNSALHIAHERGSESIEQVLREKEGESLIQLKNKEGKTADEVEVKVVIPSEIRKRGPRAIEIYRSALRDVPGNEREVPRCKLLILGEPGAGKTSLLRLLTGEGFIAEHISTEGIDTSLVQTKTLGITEKQTLATLKEDDQLSQFDDVASAEISERIKEVNSDNAESARLPLRSYKSEDEMIEEVEKLLNSPPVQQLQAAPQQSHPRQRKTVSGAFPVSRKPVAQPHASPAPKQPRKRQAAVGSFQTQSREKVPRPIHQPRHHSRRIEEQMPELSSPPSPPPSPPKPLGSRRLSENVGTRLKGHKRTEPELRLVTWDFAGQPLYHPMHHCFITYRAMYIVAFKLNEIVSGEHKEKVCKEIAFWLNTIHAHINRDETAPDSIPPIFLVGTHKDTPAETDQQTLDSIDQELKKHLCEGEVAKRWEKHISFDDTGKVFAAVENSKGSPEQRKESGVETLQQRLLETMKRLRFIREKRPIRWLKFEEEVFAMRRAVHGKPVLTPRAELRERAKGLKFRIEKDEEFDLMLQFFHDLGTVVNPRELPTLFLKEAQKEKLHDVILLNPQWLANIMRELMKVTYGSTAPTEAVRLLHTGGLAKESFLRSLWKKYLDESSQESFEQLCLFLQAFCLIIPASYVNMDTTIAVISTHTAMCSSVPPSTSQERPKSVAQDREFLVPCKLKGESNPPKSPPRPEEWLQFHFDFKGYLPAQVFHRLFCLLVINSQKSDADAVSPPTAKNEFFYNYCSLRNILHSDWWIEMQGEKQTLNVYVKPRPGTDRPPEPMIFLKYVDNNLASICDKSGLQGISYTEGPLCPHCKEIVLPLLWYGMKGRGEDPYLVHHPKLTGRPRPGETGGGPRDRDEPMIRCDTCLRDSNVYKLLKRKEIVDDAAMQSTSEAPADQLQFSPPTAGPLTVHLPLALLQQNITGLPTIPTQQESDDQNLVLAAKLKQAPRLAQLKLMKTSTGEKVEIIKALAPKWYDFGDYLDFDPTGEKLDKIKAEGLHEGPTVCCRNMFQHWLKGNSRKPATWEALIELLEDFEQPMLVQRIKCALTNQ